MIRTQEIAQVHRTPSRLKSSRIEKTAFVKKTNIVALILAAIVTTLGTVTDVGEAYVLGDVIRRPR